MAMICKNGCKECDGCMRCYEEPKPYFCPVCGKEVEEFVYQTDGEIIGCESCVEKTCIEDL